MEKKFISKRNIDIRKLFYIGVFMLSFLCTLKLITKDKTKEYFLSSFISESVRSNSAFYNNIKNTLASPKEIIYSSLNKIVPKSNLSVFSSISNDEFDYDNAKSDYVEDPEPTINNTNPIVYIYNTHQLEEYESSSTLYSVKPNVMIASYMFREKLSKLNIASIVETSNVKEYLNNNNLKYSYSYHATEEFARNATKNNPSIKYLFDIHRDSISYKYSYKEIDNVPYARVLFVVGLEHTKDNAGFAEELESLLESKYPGLSRGISYKTGTPKYGVYNPNLEGKSVLLEVGGVDNKIEEVNNTLEALANIVSLYIEGEKSEN